MSLESAYRTVSDWYLTPVQQLLPPHERRHIAFMLERAEQLGVNHAKEQLEHVQQAYEGGDVLDVFNRLSTMVQSRSTPGLLRTDTQLQLLRLMMGGKSDVLHQEMAWIRPQDDYHRVVFAFREGQQALYGEHNFEHAQACFLEALTYADMLGDKAWLCASEIEIGRTCVALGQYEQAGSRFERSFYLARRNSLSEIIPIIMMEQGIVALFRGHTEDAEFQLRKAYSLAQRHGWAEIQAIILFRQGQVYHHELQFYGLAMEYYRQAQAMMNEVPVWPLLRKDVAREIKHCQKAIENLDLARILGPVPIQHLRQSYLEGLLHHFVGIPGIENQEQLGERIGLTRQAIYRNVRRS